MLTITHTCGHTTGTHADERWDRLVEMHSRGERKNPEAMLKKTRQEFLDGHVAWLESNLCSSCYSL